MLKTIITLVRGAAFRAEEEFADRSALLILDQQIRDAAAGIERAKRALAVAIAQDEAEGKRLETTLTRIAEQMTIESRRAGETIVREGEVGERTYIIAQGLAEATSGAVCSGDERRDNTDVVLKGSYFLSGKATGAHHVVFGYDRFNDNIWANTHPSGSDFRIRATGSIVNGADIYPQFITNNTQIEYDPIRSLSKGSNLVTKSGFANDNWRWNSHLSVNLGLRLDKNERPCWVRRQTADGG